MLFKKNNKIRGAGIIYYTLDKKQHYILCVKGRMSKKFGLPKGRLKIKEKYKDCAIREMFEETNIIIPKEKINQSKYLYLGPHIYYIIEGNINTKTKINDKREISKIKWNRKKYFFNTKY